MRRIGDVFATFDDADPGCIGLGLDRNGARFFVKHPVAPHGVSAQTRAVGVHAMVRHRSLVPLLHVVTGRVGPITVYPWIDGVRLRGSRRMRDLALAKVIEAIEAVFDVHIAMEAAGFVSIDLYDGNLLFDERIHVIDIDEYRKSPFVLREDRTLGSRRFMAPEEFQRGASLDQRTMVHQLGRVAAVLLDPPNGLDLERAPGFAPVISRATCPEPRGRYASVSELATAWTRAAGMDMDGP